MIKIGNIFNKKEVEMNTNELSDLQIGMNVEVSTKYNNFLFLGKIEEVNSDSIKIVSANGEDLPYIEYNSCIKIKGFCKSKPIFMQGLIGGNAQKFWVIDRFGTIYREERRRYFRLSVSVEANVVYIENILDKNITREVTVPCRVLDISAVGAMITLEGGIFNLGDKISLKKVMLLPEQAKFDFDCVIRRVFPHDRFVEYGCEFLGLDENEEERLIKAIFLLQKEEMQKRLGTSSKHK